MNTAPTPTTGNADLPTPLQPPIGRGAARPHRPPTNLQVRMITGMVAMPLVLAVIFLGGTAFTLAVIVFFFIASLEYQGMASGNKVTPAALINAGLSVAVTLLIAFRVTWTPLVVIVWLLAVLIDVRLRRGHDPVSSANRLLIWALAVYVGCVGGFAILLRADPAGMLWYVLIPAGTWSMDTFSYVGGKLFGKHALSPRLSPHKTIEGALTGAVAAILISFLLVSQMGTLVPVTTFMILFVPLAALIGDLQESAVKRHFGVKDSAIRGFNVLPGHGGVLDRLDSLMAVILFCSMCLALLR